MGHGPQLPMAVGGFEPFEHSKSGSWPTYICGTTGPDGLIIEMHFALLDIIRLTIESYPHSTFHVTSEREGSRTLGTASVFYIVGASQGDVLDLQKSLQTFDTPDKDSGKVIEDNTCRNKGSCHEEVRDI